MPLFLCVLLLVIFCTPAYSAIGLPCETMIYGAGCLGNASGYLQIPSGGNPATSAFERPTLTELGIHSVSSLSFYQLGIQETWGSIRLFMDYQHQRPQGSATLANDLLTHGVLFEKGSALTSLANFDLYQVGLKKEFPLSCRWRISPELEVAALSFRYQIVTESEQTRRMFTHLTERVGVSGIYKVNRFLDIDFDVASSIPGLSELQVRTARTDLNVIVFNTPRLRTTLFLGVGYQFIDFKDKQPFPNHVQFVTAPIAYGGLKFYL